MCLIETVDAGFCRDDRCEILGLHAKHELKGPRQRKKKLPKGNTPEWRRGDPRGLMNCVARATSKYHPRVFSEIYRDVIDDYGPVTLRTVHRYVARLVERGQLLKLDVEFDSFVYLRPKSKLASNFEAIRERLLGEHEVQAIGRRGEIDFNRRTPLARAKFEDEEPIWIDRDAEELVERLSARG